MHHCYRAGPVASPRHCRLFKGVTCDASSRVAQLNLTALGINGQVKSLSLRNITKVITPLSNLEVLVLARLGVSGSLDDISQAGLDAFPNLSVLDVSTNPGITGPLPEEFAVCTNLQVLDVSGCGLSGTLPVSFLALQQLRELRAVGCPGLSGPLPKAWG
jgi:Leucine-rich repeat (LRR) protein